LLGDLRTVEVRWRTELLDDLRTVEVRWRTELLDDLRTVEVRWLTGLLDDLCTVATAASHIRHFALKSADISRSFAIPSADHISEVCAVMAVMKLLWR
jgi:hypothetical protein